MKTLPLILTVCVAVAIAGDEYRKAYIFSPTNFGMLIPLGFSRVDRPVQAPDFKVWAFTNAAGSRLTFAIGGHWGAKGEKADFRGCAALDFKTNLVRRIIFDASGFSHSELEHVGRPPRYNAVLECRASGLEDEKRLKEAIASFAVQSKRKESNKTNGE